MQITLQRPIVASRPGLVTAVIKRVTDVMLAAVALTVLAPVLALCAVAVASTSRGPVLFRQRRVGRAGREFEVLKFRTMTYGASDVTHREQAQRELAGEASAGGTVAFKDREDPRITPIGRWLRRFSLDELPQLVNVLGGQMSLVGPRPCLGYEHEGFPAWSRTRLDVRPGLTGLWQVSGRNDLSLLEMLELDCRYAQQVSIAQDLAILWRTVPVVLTGAGAA